MTPRVSVVIPCYNQAEYLPDALGSLLAQTEPAWEAVVVNDCSTSGDPEGVVNGLRDPRICVVHHSRNRGLAAARNTGIRQSACELVLPMDADDMLAPRYLERVAGALDDHPEGDCAFADFELFGAEVGVRRFRMRDVAALFYEQWLPGPGTLMRRSLWERAGGYCEAEPIRKGNEDWEFWISAARCGFYAIHLPEPLYRYRRHPDSMSVWQKSYEHSTRPYIYRRHKAFFDRYRAGSGFKARAYYASASAAWRGRHPLRAGLLAARGFLHRVLRRDCLQRLFAALAGESAPPWGAAPERPAGLTLGPDASAANRGLSGPPCARADARPHRVP
jgi:glycosyltransferase involved in cell wall biosynthesis